MNPFFLIFIGVPALEIFTLIKIGSKIGALTTVSLIFLTAVIGIYFAKIEGIKTMRSGLVNLYQNKLPLYEIMSGASIAIAALFLIIPGFLTDLFGFLLLIPISRKFLINSFLNKKNQAKQQSNKNVLDGEIVDKKEKKDEL